MMASCCDGDNLHKMEPLDIATLNSDKPYKQNNVVRLLLPYSIMIAIAVILISSSIPSAVFGDQQPPLLAQKVDVYDTKFACICAFCIKYC